MGGVVCGGSRRLCHGVCGGEGGGGEGGESGVRRKGRVCAVFVLGDKNVS